MTAPNFATTITRARRYPFLYKPNDALGIDALSGQVGTLVRTTTRTATDSFGTSYTVNHSQPAFDVVSGVSTLILGASEYVKYTWDVPPVALCFCWDFFENGTLAAGTAIMSLSNATPASPYLELTSTTTQYTLLHHNGSASVSSTMSGTAPTSGQRIRLFGTVFANGSVQLAQQINAGAITTATASGANALAAAWSAPTSLYLNSFGVGNYGNHKLAGAVIMRGNQSTAKLLEALA